MLSLMRIGVLLVPLAGGDRSERTAVAGSFILSDQEQYASTASRLVNPQKRQSFLHAPQKDRRACRLRYTFGGLTALLGLNCQYVVYAHTRDWPRRPSMRRRSGRTTSGRSPMRAVCAPRSDPTPPILTRAGASSTRATRRSRSATTPHDHDPQHHYTARPRPTDEAPNRNQRNEDSSTDVNGYRHCW